MAQIQRVVLAAVEVLRRPQVAVGSSFPPVVAAVCHYPWPAPAALSWLFPVMAVRHWPSLVTVALSCHLLAVVVCRWP